MEVNILQSDMTEEMKKIISSFVLQGFKTKNELEYVSKYIKDDCDKKFGDEFLCIIVDKYAPFGSCLKCAPGSLFMGEYQNYRIIIFRI